MDAGAIGGFEPGVYYPDKGKPIVGCSHKAAPEPSDSVSLGGHIEELSDAKKALLNRPQEKLVELNGFMVSESHKIACEAAGVVPAGWAFGLIYGEVIDGKVVVTPEANTTSAMFLFPELRGFPGC
jgi:hypothetical protein